MGNRKEQFRMEIESLPKNEEFARVVVAVFINRMNLTLEGLGDVKTTVSEAVTNAMTHGYQEKDGVVYMEASVEGDEPTVIVKDKDVSIRDVKQTVEPMLMLGTTGECPGIGLSLMEAFMDEVRAESAPDEEATAAMKKRIGG